MLARNRAEIERSVINIRDATDWANRTVQKIYANPIVVTPFYKPSREEQRVQAVFDTALQFTKGAQELHDAIKTLEILSARPQSQQQQQQPRTLERPAQQQQQNVQAPRGEPRTEGHQQRQEEHKQQPRKGENKEEKKQ